MWHPRITAALAVCAALATPALAQDRPLTEQQERMKSCNARASDQHMKGEARREYMSQCLRGDNDLTAQQEKMVACNRGAGERKLAGEERRAYMSECLSAKHDERAPSAAGGR